MTTESGIKRKLCRDLPREKGEAFEVWNKELLDAGHGEGDEDASWSILSYYGGTICMDNNGIYFLLRWYNQKNQKILKLC